MLFDQFARPTPRPRPQPETAGEAGDGVWAIYIADGDWRGAKIAALGLKIRGNGCTYHGVSLNVSMDLAPFGWINPCGYAGLATVDMKTLGVDAPLALAGPRHELFSLTATAAAQGLGVALVPRLLVEEELARGELVVACDRPWASGRRYWLVTPELAEVTMRAENTVELGGDDAQRMQKLLDVLEDLDDVQEVYHNAGL